MMAGLAKNSLRRYTCCNGHCVATPSPRPRVLTLTWQLASNEAFSIEIYYFLLKTLYNYQDSTFLQQLPNTVVVNIGIIHKTSIIRGVFEHVMPSLTKFLIKRY